MVVAVVSTENEVVVAGEVGDSVRSEGVVEKSGIVGVEISVVWPILEPAVLWAVVDVVSWKRATTVGVSFSRAGVVWGIFSLGVLVVVPVDGIGLDVSRDWLIATLSMKLTSDGAVVVIDSVVASGVSLSAISVVKGTN